MTTRSRGQESRRPLLVCVTHAAVTRGGSHLEVVVVVLAVVRRPASRVDERREQLAVGAAARRARRAHKVAVRLREADAAVGLAELDEAVAQLVRREVGERVDADLFCRVVCVVCRDETASAWNVSGARGGGVVIFTTQTPTSPTSPPYGWQSEHPGRRRRRRRHDDADAGTTDHVCRAASRRRLAHYRVTAVHTAVRADADADADADDTTMSSRESPPSSRM